ncbi:MAG TPA: hypothetical protein GXZ70_03455 [Clostridiales bacterium]|nr:hypothetical protein [Clostridiales bacterium]
MDQEGELVAELWGKKDEERFFLESLKNYAAPEQLFYSTAEGKYLAYWPKGYKGPKTTLQSRNALIGSFTEKWVANLIKNIVDSKNYFVVQGAICKKIGLTSASSADVIISKSKERHQTPDNILLIIEVKMSIVWNWQYINKDKVICIGDYRTHQGNPGLLRSDSMLKAIGKSINIRVSSIESSKIPILIIGNTPITKSYMEKVDRLKVSGIIQGFWSINPTPLDNSDSLKKTDNCGFYRFDNIKELSDNICKILSEERNFFSSMKSNRELGQIIEIANRQKTYEEKAQMFLKLVRE